MAASDLRPPVPRGVRSPVHGAGEKQRICCPLHADTRPSAFITDIVFFCSVCTPGNGWSRKRFDAEVAQRGLPPFGPAYGRSSAPASRSPQGGGAYSAPRREKPAFTPQHAQAIWQASLARALDDSQIGPDGDVYAYLNRRGLSEAWEARLFGILPIPAPLVPGIHNWVKGSYRLIVPLYDSTGVLSSVQGRAVANRELKVLSPTGSRMRGLVFANAPALQILRNEERSRQPIVVMAEGLTDFLAISIATSLPVFSAPGTGMAPKAFGPWGKGREVLLALDNDPAGANALTPTARAIGSFGGGPVRWVKWRGDCKDACDALLQSGLEAMGRLFEPSKTEVSHG